MNFMVITYFDMLRKAENGILYYYKLRIKYPSKVTVASTLLLHGCDTERNIEISFLFFLMTSLKKDQFCLQMSQKTWLYRQFSTTRQDVLLYSSKTSFGSPSSLLAYCRSSLLHYTSFLASSINVLFCTI